MSAELSRYDSDRIIIHLTARLTMLNKKKKKDPSVRGRQNQNELAQIILELHMLIAAILAAQIGSTQE